MLPAELLRHPFLATANAALDAQEREYEAGGAPVPAATPLTPAVSSRPAGGGGPASPRIGSRRNRDILAGASELLEVVRKVQKFRFWSALKQGHMRLAEIPRESFAALAEQMGLETAFVARVFQKYQVKLDMHLTKHQLTRGHRRTALPPAAALSPRPPSARATAAAANVAASPKAAVEAEAAAAADSAAGAVAAATAAASVEDRLPAAHSSPHTAHDPAALI